jgi:hypothetical protein
MRHQHRLLVIAVLIALVLAIPSAAFANKRVWKARLSTDAELHEVVGSTARGSLILATNPDGSLHFILQVRELSGPVSGAHFHAPADTTQNASVKLTLCGNPAPSAFGGACPFDNGTMYVEGDITPSLLAAWGLPGGTFFDWLDAGLVYVNVHTALNPAGESRGQLAPQ